MTQTFNDSEGWRKLEYTAQDGLRLAGRLYGERNRDSLPVVCLAGLTRNSADFHTLALHLSRLSDKPHRVLALDYRGRGMSARDPDWRNYNPITEADDVVQGLMAADIADAAFIGTSRGGVIAMILAAMRPGMLKCVILNDVGPQVDPKGLLRIRGYIENGRDFTRWSDAVDAVRAIGKPQFPDFSESDWERQARMIFAEHDGKFVRRYDPAIMKTLKSIDAEGPLPTMWPQFAGLAAVPVMAIRSENSDILDKATLAKMAGAHPRLEVVSVPRQGHAPDPGSAGLPATIARFIAQAG